jgi:4-hydroxybenzoate polyprenyltransferase
LKLKPAPTLWSVWIASGGRPSADILIIFVVGTLLMRSAGCAINDFADRAIDPHVARTRSRPLAAGEIRPGEALAVAAVLAAAAFGLVLFLNGLAILSFVALAIAASYPTPSGSSGCRSFGWASPSASASRWPTPRSRTACARMLASLRQRLLFVCLRYRVRDGRPR